MKPQSPTYVEIAAGDDPEAALYAIVGLRDLMNILEHRQVAAARELGWTWDQIAHILGVSRQAASKRLQRGDSGP
jgi:DNA-directed RNA polymerase specialized sigma24 family protein